MKKKLFTAFACLVMVSIMVIPAVAETPWTAFEGTLSFVEPLPGGEEWYSKDFTKVYARNIKERYTMDVDDPRLDGVATLTANFSFHITDFPVFVYGPIWGSVYLENEGGYWEGRVAGERTKEGFNDLSAVLHGHGGYEGMHAKVDFWRGTTDLYGDFVVKGEVR